MKTATKMKLAATAMLLVGAFSPFFSKLNAQPPNIIPAEISKYQPLAGQTAIIQNQIAKIQPLPDPITIQDSSYDRKLFFGPERIKFEAQSGKYPQEETGAMIARCDSLMDAVIIEAAKLGIVKTPKNDKEVAMLMGAAQAKNEKKVDYSWNAFFYMDRFSSKPSRDCYTSTYFLGDVGTVYGLECNALVVSPKSVLVSFHDILEVKTPWGSTLYFEPESDPEPKTRKYVEQTYRILGTSPINKISWQDHSILGIYYYYDANDYKNARKSFGKAFALDSSNAYIYDLRGLYYLQAREYDNAIADFSKVIENDSTFAHPYYMRAKAFANSGKIENALSDISTCLKFYSDFPEAISYRYNVLYGTLDMEKERMEDLNTLVYLYQNFIEPYDLRKFAEFCRNNKKDASVLYFNCVEYIFHYEQSKIYFETYDSDSVSSSPDYLQSIKYLKRKDMAFTAYYEGALASLEMGYYPEALDDLSKCLELDPKNKMVLKAIADVSAKQKYSADQRGEALHESMPAQ